MPEKISILKESGETLNSNIVSIFMIPDTEKKYVITTENAVDPHGLTVLHVSELVDGNLQRVATDEEWSAIKTIMRAIISGNVGTFQYLPVVENVNASGQYSRDISVSSTAANQMINSYNNGEKNLVNQQAQQPEPVQPIQNIGAANNPVAGAPAAPANVQPVETVSQPVVNPGVVNVGAEQVPSSVTPVVTADQVLSPGVNPVMQVNPVTPEVQPVVPVAQPATVQPEVVAPVPGMTPEVSVNQPVAGNVGMEQTAAIPIVNNIMPAQGEVVPPIVVDNQPPVEPTPVVVDSVQPPQPVQPINNPGLVNGDSVITPLVIANDENNANPVNPVLGDSQIPQGQIVQPSEADVVSSTETPVGSFAPDASLDEVVAASQQMFMEGVKNLVQTIQEKVYRELYAKEEELKKREEELNQRENSLTGMTNPMDAAPVNPVSPVTPPTPMMGTGMANPMDMQQPMAPMMPPGGMMSPTGMQQPTMVSVSNDSNINV